ncbi:hypothetical protein CAPTEDRAFT_136677 [Capitella teleta]|uniref:Sushi domain-containing protein n=1 Tax=Capitella teleta TaxID=283909 RepID=R7U890_CAPTE|nr:hypothetical protein CAPTEDRAFT_136677 [Capitella teleta]|eukprot:ELU02209.1 hypothetical protein CAPTEDRAFT_136677 [Capitella teleta]
MVKNGDAQGYKFTLGGIVNFTCDPGFVLVGANQAECLSTGHWSTPAPKCQVVRCQTPTLRDNILVQPENLQPNVYNSRLTFSCKAGFQLRGSTTIRCLANAQWDDVVPICEAVRCPPLPTPENGGVEVFAFTYGNTATFICFPGYSLVGHINSTCQANATWDHAVSLCRGKCISSISVYMH